MIFLGDFVVHDSDSDLRWWNCYLLYLSWSLFSVHKSWPWNKFDFAYLVWSGCWTRMLKLVPCCPNCVICQLRTNMILLLLIGFGILGVIATWWLWCLYGCECESEKQKKSQIMAVAREGSHRCFIRSWLILIPCWCWYPDIILWAKRKSELKRAYIDMTVASVFWNILL